MGYLEEEGSPRALSESRAQCEKVKVKRKEYKQGKRSCTYKSTGVKGQRGACRRGAGGKGRTKRELRRDSQDDDDGKGKR